MYCGCVQSAPVLLKAGLKNAKCAILLLIVLCKLFAPYRLLLIQTDQVKESLLPMSAREKLKPTLKTCCDLHANS